MSFLLDLWDSQMNQSNGSGGTSLTTIVTRYIHMSGIILELLIKRLTYLDKQG